MKKYILQAIFFLAAICILVACTGTSMPPAASDVAEAAAPPLAAAPITGIALVSSQQKLDSEFGQVVWNTLSQFAGKNNYSFATYKTEGNEQEEAIATLELAVQGGAKLVVGMDAVISEALAKTASQYSDVDFMLFDNAPFQTLSSNTVSFQFSHVQAGWLAGYVAMREARGDIGLISGGGDDSIMYSLGYLLGADAAAKTMALEPYTASVVQLKLTNDADPNEWQSEISRLFINDANIVFCSMPAAQNETELAATTNYKWAIGFQTTPSRAIYGVLASINFNPKSILQTQLNTWHTGGFNGGTVAQGDVQNLSIILEYEAESFSETGAGALARIPALLTSEDNLALLARRMQKNSDGSWPTPDELELEYIGVRPPTQEVEDE